MDRIVEFKDGSFLISDVDHCPLYVSGEEFVLENGVLRLPQHKPTCLILAQDLAALTSSGENARKVKAHGRSGEEIFNCAGCARGMIRFGYKKTRGFATTQMQMLAEAKQKRKFTEARIYFKLLRTIKVFSALSDEELLEMAGMLDFVDFQPRDVIARKGDPGVNLFILLSGSAEVMDEKGIALDEISEGDVFGEMSLLSGDRVSQTIVAAGPCRAGILDKDRFRSFLNRYPALQNYFYKLLVDRINEGNRRRGDTLSSGMVGQLTDIAPVELCQMVNSSRKTGRLNLDYEDSIDGEKGALLFNDGEVVSAELGELQGQEAFYRILSIENGRFRFIPGLSRAESRLQPLGGFMALLMEGAKYCDDENEEGFESEEDLL